METRDKFRPFTGDSESLVHLANAPLAMVLCQLRWPDLSALQGDISAFVHRFGESMTDYPLFREVPGVNFKVTAEGIEQVGGSTAYQWSTADESVCVTLTHRFLTLHQVRDYTSFATFHQQLEEVTSTLLRLLNPPFLDRVGVRYVNRVSDSGVLERLPSMLPAELMGLYGLRIPESAVTLKQSMNQGVYQVGGGYLQVRSGLVPEGLTLDPAIAPLTVPSWVLDLDAFEERRVEASVEELMALTGRLADTAYDFFKLVATPDFASTFGGSNA